MKKFVVTSVLVLCPFVTLSAQNVANWGVSEGQGRYPDRRPSISQLQQYRDTSGPRTMPQNPGRQTVPQGDGRLQNNGGPVRYATIVDPWANGGQGAPPFFSFRLQAKFVVEPGGGRRVTELGFNSPLKQMGIEVGDVIINLDGLPVDSNWELNNHIHWTTVDVIDWRTGKVVRGKIFIQ